MVDEIGPEHVVHVITDNGSNYKKACKGIRETYEHISWTPCLAHTVNLMLKDIGERYEHQDLIDQCKKISTWLHNHGQLNAMMRQAIGGELVKWCATRFGTNYMFLDSMYRKRDRFMQWMASPEFLQSKWANSNMGRFTHTRFSSLQWCEGMKFVIDSVQPIYSLLRFADQDKRPNMCEVCHNVQSVRNEMQSFFGRNVSMYEEYIRIYNARLKDIFYDTYVVPGKTDSADCEQKFILSRSIHLMLIRGTFYFAASVLNPRYAYTFIPSPEMWSTLKDAFQRMTDISSAVQALQEAELFRQRRGDFATQLAQQMVLDPKTTASSWWMVNGNRTPKLQSLALRLVSQCCSSSGCERNWSTFALLHTKVRNRLSHKKLNKLVYVNYNLRLRLADVADPPRDQGDFVEQLAHLSFYDPKNPVREWMEYGRSNKAPVLDEDDDEGDTPLPSNIVADKINPADLRTSTGEDCISDWARRHVGDTHVGKRKYHIAPSKVVPKRQRGQATGKGKQKEIEVLSDEDTDDGEGDKSPEYQESQDSSSGDDGDDSNDGDGSSDGDDSNDGGGSGGGSGGATGGGGGGGVSPSNPPAGLHFTGTKCTYI
ncbi:DUF domain-containing protein [Robertmurraya kyonggiensis]|uniref:DUF domain-containing protein n=1 Tax=Robertmurraya kyonggiensis TaxID=1037680 RepID=A0A4U1D036_9BACI|nr:DUF domain-containing protein [Robertmurraya kyonggiensis]